MRIRLAIASVGACVLLTGCGADSPTAPSSVSLTGTWTGTVTSPVLWSGDPNPGRSGPATATFRQDGQTVTGTYAGPGDPAEFTGTVDGDTVTLFFDGDECDATAIATKTGRTMTIKDFQYTGRAYCQGLPLVASLTKQ
jgi:hypothetical protein